MLHALDHLPPDRVLAGEAEAALIVEAHVELTVGGIRISGPRRADSASPIGITRELGLQIGQIGAARSGAGRIAGLGHETVDDTVEFDAVIEALGGQRLDALDVFRREVRQQLHHYLASLEFDDECIVGRRNWSGGSRGLGHGERRGCKAQRDGEDNLLQGKLQEWR